MIDHRAVHHPRQDRGLERKQTRYRIPNVYLFSLRRNTRGIDWVPNHEWLMLDHQVGPDAPERSRDAEHGDPRFYTNAQFVLYAHEKCVMALRGCTPDDLREWEERAGAALPPDAPGAERARLNYDDLVTALLYKAAGAEAAEGAAVHAMMHSRCEAHALRPTPAMYQAVFAAYAAECPPHDAAEGDVAGWDARGAAVVRGIDGAVAELHDLGVGLDLQTCTAVLDALVRGRTLRGNDYFVKHMLRGFAWNNDQIAILLREYREVGNRCDTAMQTKLCKRAHIWCQRYNVGMSEENKQYVEDDYDRTGVQVRTKDELLAWKFRHQHQQREELRPYLPNPVTDRVTHTLRFGDHQDPEHCDKWVVPYSNAGRTFNWEYSQRPHPPPQASDVRDLTDVERVKRLPQQNLLSPWLRVRDWQKRDGQPYRPELNHEKLHINRWLEEPNKAFPGA